MAASKQAINRLRKELKCIAEDPPPLIHVYCDEENILRWYYLMEGPEDTPYVDGWYFGKLTFPREYPFAPPGISMRTPNGRFVPDMKICMSMSDYHPETWQPSWSLATVLKGLLSFMCEDCPAAGVVMPGTTRDEKKALARGSAAWNKATPEFNKAFPDFDALVTAREERLRTERAARERVRAEQVRRPPAARTDEDFWKIAGEDLDDTGTFKVGDKVRIKGLKARLDLNGQVAIVRTLNQGPEKRIHVATGKEDVRVKESNLDAVPEGTLL